MKRLTFLLYLLIAGLSGLYATDSLSVQFKVIDCDGSPLANASLSVEGISGKTNEEGYFSTKIVKKDGVWATYNYEVYPTGYPYLTGQFKEEDLKEEIRVSYEHCVKLAIRVSGVYDSSDPYSGNIKGTMKCNNSGYSFIVTKEENDAILWTIKDPINSLIDIQIEGLSYNEESFFYSTQLEQLNTSSNLFLDIHKDLIRVDVNLSEDTRKYGTLEWYETNNTHKRNYTSISSKQTLLLNPAEYQVVYSTSYSDETDAKIYSEIYGIKNIPEQVITIEANPTNYHKINIQVTGVPEVLHRELYTEVTSNSIIEQYGSDNLYFRNNYDLYLKDGIYNCRLYTFDNSDYAVIPQNIPITIDGKDENVLIDYTNYILIPIHVQINQATSDVYLNYIISDENESINCGKIYNEQWKSTAFLEIGKEYQIVSWLPGYQTIELKKIVTNNSEIELNFTEYKSVTKIEIATILQPDVPSEEIKVTLAGVGVQTISSSETAVFYNVPEGKCTLIIEHPDCPTKTIEFEIDIKGNASIDIPENVFMTYMKSLEQYFMKVWIDDKDTRVSENKISDICSIQLDNHKIELSAIDHQSTSVAIFNESGFCLIKKAFRDYLTIPTNEWAKGIYILQITSGNKTQTIKFIR